MTTEYAAGLSQLIFQIPSDTEILVANFADAYWTKVQYRFVNEIK